MLFLFAARTSSIIWEYNHTEFHRMVEESVEKPIVMLLYATWCPMCHGVPEKYDKFIERGIDDPNVIYTKHNCLDRQYCYELGARSIPYICVIRGTDVSKWHGTNDMNPSSWRKFVDNNLKYDI